MDWKGRAVKQCPSCSSGALLSAGIRKDGARVSRCSECGLGFLNPMPTEEEIEGMYASYFSRGDGTGYADYKVDWKGTGLDRLLWDRISRFNSAPIALLDVGCAFGTRVLFFQKRGLRTTGVDISDEAVRRGLQKNLDLHSCRFEEFKSDTTYDVVTMIDFVEHLSKPESWAGKLQSMTRKGSIVAILTPDFECYDDYGERWIGYNLSFEHLLFFNRRSLSVILERFGFQLLMSENVRTADPVVAEEARHGGGRTRLAKAVHMVHADRILAGWRGAKDRIMWRHLVNSRRRENSLLIVAVRR